MATQTANFPAPPPLPLDASRLGSARKKLRDFMAGAKPRNGLEAHPPLGPRVSHSDDDDDDGTPIVSPISSRVVPLAALEPPGTPAPLVNGAQGALGAPVSREDSETPEPLAQQTDPAPSEVPPGANGMEAPAEEVAPALEIVPVERTEPDSEARVAKITEDLQAALAAAPEPTAPAPDSAPREIAAPAALEPPPAAPSQPFSFFSSLVSVVPSSDPSTQPNHPTQRIARLEALSASLAADLEASRRERARVVEAANAASVRLLEELRAKEAEVVKREREKHEARERELEERIAELEGFLRDMAGVHGKVRKGLEAQVAELRGRCSELQILLETTKAHSAPAVPEAEPVPEASTPTGARTGADVLADSIATRAVAQLRGANARLRKDVEEAHGVVDRQQARIEELIRERDDVERELHAERSRRTSVDSEAALAGFDPAQRRADAVANRVLLMRNLVASPISPTFPTMPDLPVVRPPSNLSSSASVPVPTGGGDDSQRTLSNKYNLLQQQHHALAKRLEEQVAANRELKRLIVQASLGPAVPAAPAARRSGSLFFGRKSAEVPDPASEPLLLERFAEVQEELARVKAENEGLKVRVGELEWAVHEVVHEVDAAHKEGEAEAEAEAAGGEKPAVDAATEGQEAPEPMPQPAPAEDRKPPIRKETIDALKEKLGVAPGAAPAAGAAEATSLLGLDLRACCDRCGPSAAPAVML
ncbi:hypothetical protein DFJ74DRAFT_704991 [Hyaloraphidium curvatum]|nr:hypothetical protein DFJ74DRAFT_704991 [Hyaloraphidium curvatum]